MGQVVELAIEELESQGYSSSSIVGYETRYSITTDGYRFIEAALGYPKSFVSVLSEKGNKWLFDTGGFGPGVDPREIEDDTSPSSEGTDDGAWEPLPLDRANKNVESAADALEALEEAVRSDNGYSAQYPEERNAISSALKSGITALREQNELYDFQLRAYVIIPLRLLGERFKKAVLGELVDSAKAAIRELAKKSWIEHFQKISEWLS